MGEKAPVKYRFKKGTSGNPKGKPKGSISLTRAIKEYLLKQAKSGETYKDKLTRATVLRAIAKSDVLIKEIWDRIDGKVPTPMDTTLRAKLTISQVLDALENGSSLEEQKLENEQSV